MPATQYGPNFGEAMIQGAEIQKQNMLVQQQQQKMNTEAEFNSLSGGYQNAPDSVVPPTNPNDPGAFPTQPTKSDYLKQMLAVDPENTKKLFEAVKMADEAKKKQMDAHAEEVGQYCYMVNSAMSQAPTGQEQAAYEHLITLAPPSIKDKLPKSFNKGFFDYGVITSIGTKELVRLHPTAVTASGTTKVHNPFGGIDSQGPSDAMIVMQNSNNQRAMDRNNSRGNAIIAHNGKGGGGATGEPKTADKNLMWRQLQAHYGGFYDANTGLMTFRDKGQSAKATIAYDKWVKGGYKGTAMDMTQDASPAPKNSGAQPKKTLFNGVKF